ncbi:MAG TPA: tripartite tricarboxylate transporter substrate binding protein [Caldimonas sp.]|nr:tripartite tricarboxylate transporter substrate binding protein [Caldimonas sp.]
MPHARRIILRWLAAPVLAAATLALPSLAVAQTWPSRPVRLIIPYPPGGLADTFARVLAEGLASRLGQQVLVDNRPGASLTIGTDAVAKAPADGYTLLLGSVSSLAINAAAFKKLAYDPVKDFAPVSLTFRTPLLLVVPNELPVNSVRELIAYAKTNPGALSYASLGYGSSLHIAAEHFKSLAKIDILHVPYKGTTTAMPDLMTNRVSMMFDGGALLPQVREGKMKLLGVTSAKRLAALPNVPTIAEAGVPGYEMDFWFGIVAPAGTPRAVIDRLAAEIAEVEKQPALRAKLASFGNVEYETGTPEAMAEIIKRDLVRWQQLLREYKVEPQ